MGASLNLSGLSMLSLLSLMDEYEEKKLVSTFRANSSHSSWDRKCVRVLQIVVLSDL